MVWVAPDKLGWIWKKAETCRQCKGCRGNHTPDCVVALVRSSVEFAALIDNIPYPGSVFMCLAGIKGQNY